MDSNDLDNILAEIEGNKINTSNSLTESGTKDLTVVNFNGTDISVDDNDAMVAAIFSSALEDKKKADELYKVMEDRLNFDKDRSPEAKTVLSEAVNHRINATGNLIKLLDLKNKYSAKAASGNSLVNLNISPRESGINIKNLADEIING